MKAGILGYSGFLGQNTVNYLQEMNYSVLPIDIREEKWGDLLDENQIDVLINFVGKAHDHNNKAKAEDFYFANFEIVKQIFEKFKKSSCKLLIHISSIAALEEEESNEMLTEENVSNAKSHYGKSKRKAEEFLISQVLDDGKKIIILRPTMIHGNGDKGNLKLLYNIISKGIPYPFGAFKNERSFLVIDNFCFLIAEIINKETQISSGIYNVTDDFPSSTIEIINIIGKLKNKKVHVLKVPKVIINLVGFFGSFFRLAITSRKIKKMTSSLVVSNNKIKSALGVEKLPLTVQEGLEKTIQGFIDNQNVGKI